MRVLRGLMAWLADPIHLTLTLASLLPMLLVLVYVMSYRLETPFRDEWNLNGRVAIAAVDGTMTLDTLSYVAGGHRTLFTNLATAFSAEWQHWDLRTLGLLTPLLGLISVILLAGLFARFGRGATAAVVLPFSLLVFAVFRTYNWWSVRQSHWTLVNVWFMAALLVAARERLTWKALLLALVLGWCCTFSSAAGMLIWPVVVAVWGLFGLRDWRKYAVWIVPGLVAIAVYLYDSGMLPGLSSGAVNIRDEVLRVDMPNLRDLAEFVLKFLGNALLPYDELATLAAAIGLIGLLLLAVHVVVFWRGRRLKPLALWLAPVAFSLGSAVLVGLARINNVSVDRAFTVQYIAAAGMFWVGLIALMALAIQQFAAGRGGRALAVLNVVIGFGLLCVYGFSSVAALQQEAAYWEHGLTLTASTSLRPDEQCVEDFLFTRDTACLNRVTRAPRGDSYWLDELATRRLSIFVNLPVISLMPGDYQPGSPVVLATSDAWLNVHVRDLLLEGADDNSLFHVVAGGADLDRVADIPRPLQHVSADGAPSDAFAASLAGAHQVWLVRALDSAGQTDAYAQVAQQAGFVPVFDDTVGRVGTPIKLRVSGFARLNDAPHLMFRLGDHVSLQGWMLEDSVDVRSCQAVALQSLWSTDAPLSINHAITAVLAGSDGIGVARADGPTTVLTSHWQPGQFTLDRRSLSIPCDLKPGDYSLLLGLYDPDTLKSLPATTADGGPVGGLIYLTTLHVQP